MISWTSLIFLLLHGKYTFADDCVTAKLENGHIRGEGDVKSWTGTYHCDPGFTLVGTQRLKCRDGQWSSHFPVCTAVGSCDPSELPQIENGRADPYKTRKFRGSVYKYSCDRDYNRFGHSLVHCSGKSWDLTRVPLCHTNTCHQSGMSEMTGGAVVRAAGGGVYYYRCTAPGSELHGSSTLVCTQHGWNDTVPQCFFGPGSVTLSGPDTVTSGEIMTYECISDGSNPVVDITWQVTTHDGRDAQHLLQISEMTSTKTDSAGWMSVSEAQVSLPAHDREHILGLHVSCSAQNVQTKSKLSQHKTVSVHFAPKDLMISGPAEVKTRESVIVTCHTSASVPPAQVSWIVSPSVKHLETSETVHQEEDGSFKTLSSMSLYVPESAEEDVVVECVAKHQTLDAESNIAAIHIIKIEAPTTSTSTSTSSSTTTTTTEEMRTSRANWDAPSINYDNLMQGMTDYSYDEMDDLYYEDTEIEAVDQSVEEDDKNVPHDKIPDESDTEREIAENDAAKSDYNKYNIEPEPQDNVTHILMNNLDEKNFTILDAEMTHDVNGVTSLNETDSTLIKDIKTKDETSAIAINASTKSFDADTAENTKENSEEKTKKTKPVPVKASRIMNSAVNGQVSIFCAMICVIGVKMMM